MPKEISHWYLAHRVKSHLPESSVFFDPIHTCGNLFFLGAVAPDIPFYYLLGPGSDRIQAAAEPFHRPNARALIPVFSFLDQMQKPGMDARALSLGAGIICHIFADTAFHPLVYYYSGMSGVHAGATARHRQFETALDLYFLHQADVGARISLGGILSQTEIPVKRLLAYLGRLFALEKPGDGTCLGYAVRSHALAHALFQNKTVYRILHRLDTGRHRFMDPFLSLFYPDDQEENASFFEHKFEYRDPDTGQECFAGIADLVREMETGTLSVLSRVSERMMQQRSLTDLAEDSTLPRVKPGIAQGRFWREKQNLKTNLFRKKR
ncbi:MAG: zinc dependent phospholipase C family protein [Desulfotignum sp.]